MAAYTSVEAAAARARTLAMRSSEDRHVVRDVEEGGDLQYAVASDFDLETWYAGATVLATATPDGEVEFA